ncbi:MAG TPA: hypothetical protein VE685_20480 [Thermoanaerobaculia bacterium]|nr:hypothetical protein [Thermoanaerobaculia bacterium]
MLDESIILPFTFPAPHHTLGGLVTLADDGLELEFQRRVFFSVRENTRKIRFEQIRDVRVHLVRQGWFRPKLVLLEICTRSLQPLRGVPGSVREKLWLYTGAENLDTARCLEQVLLLKLLGDPCSMPGRTA